MYFHVCLSLCIHVCLCECLPVHPCVCVSAPVSARLPARFLCAECVPRVGIHILNHALFEVKMWLPAAIKRRQQLENKRAGGGAPGQLPCFRAGLHFSGEVLSGRSDERTGGEDARKGRRERLRDA